MHTIYFSFRATFMMFESVLVYPKGFTCPEGSRSGPRRVPYMLLCGPIVPLGRRPKSSRRLGRLGPSRRLGAGAQAPFCATFINVQGRKQGGRRVLSTFIEHVYVKVTDYIEYIQSITDLKCWFDRYDRDVYFIKVCLVYRGESFRYGSG